MRHQRNEDSKLGGAGPSPFCQLVYILLGTKKQLSLCCLAGNYKLWWRLQHVFLIGEKLIMSALIWGTLKELIKA